MKRFPIPLLLLVFGLLCWSAPQSAWGQSDDDDSAAVDDDDDDDDEAPGIVLGGGADDGCALHGSTAELGGGSLLSILILLGLTAGLRRR